MRRGNAKIGTGGAAQAFAGKLLLGLSLLVTPLKGRVGTDKKGVLKHPFISEAVEPLASYNEVIKYR